MAKFATNLSGAILLPSSIQVSESISGSVVPLAMFSEFLQTLAHFENFDKFSKVLTRDLD